MGRGISNRLEKKLPTRASGVARFMSLTCVVTAFSRCLSAPSGAGVGVLAPLGVEAVASAEPR